MNVVGRVGSFISQGVTTVASPFHPFGGAVDIIVVQREDGTYRSTPWCVRFGKFQGVLKVSEKIVSISVNGSEVDFHMYLDNSGEAYFLKEVYNDVDDNDQDENMVKNVGENDLEEKGMAVFASQNKLNVPEQHIDEEDSMFTVDELGDEQSSEENEVDFLSSTSSYHYHNTVSMQLSDDRFHASQSSGSEVILMTVDGHLITAPAPVSSSEDMDNVQLDTPHFYLVSDDESGMRLEDLQESNEYEGEEFVEPKIDGGEICMAPHSGEGAHFVHFTQEFRASYKNGLPKRISDPPNKDNFDGFSSDTHVKDDDHPAMIEDTFSSKANDEYSPVYAQAESDKDGNSMPSLSELSERCETDNQEDARHSPVGPPDPESNQQLHRDNYALVNGEISDKAFHETEGGLGKEASPSHVREAAEEFATESTSSPNSFEDCTTASDKVSEKPNEHMTTSHLETGMECTDGVTDNMDNSEFLSIPPERQTHGLNLCCLEISLCGNLLHAGMGVNAAAEAFKTHQISEEEFKSSSMLIVKNKNLVIRSKGKYLAWDKAAAIVLGMAAFGFEFPSDPPDAIPVEQEDVPPPNVQGTSLPSRGWRFWPIQFRPVKTLEQNSTNSLNEVTIVTTETLSQNSLAKTVSLSSNRSEPQRNQFMRTNIPTNEQLASLKLKEGQNVIAFSFCTRVLGKQQVDARIYLWKSNARIVISDVDGTITKSDVLGQFMPLVGKDWTQSGVARLFSSIKENGYQLLFLSARAIVQAYLTRNFLHNLKQDGKALPTGPVFISPDGLSYSFIREVVRRKPHEFKIACLEEIRALFPSDYNPFYAGFGNRDTDELSYRKVGIPKGKIFIINPKGEVAINNCVDSRSYCSLHTLVNDMFPPTSLTEQEDFNSWNYWKLPAMHIEV